jgi:hypothetical protein
MCKVVARLASRATTGEAETKERWILFGFIYQAAETIKIKIY